MGQERQFVASPAAMGLRALRNWERKPDEEIVDGRWGGDVSSAFVGEQRSQKRISISWQDLVRRLGAVVSSLLQFPLPSISFLYYFFSMKRAVKHSPNIRVAHMPPPNRLSMLDTDHIPYDPLLPHKPP